MKPYVTPKTVDTDLGNLDWSSRRLKSRMNSINDLRNAVAHPARMLVRSPDDVDRLWARVSTIEDLVFTIRTHLMGA